MTEGYVVGMVEILEKLTKSGCGEVDRGAAMQFMAHQLQQSVDAYNAIKHDISTSTIPEWMSCCLEMEKS